MVNSAKKFTVKRFERELAAGRWQHECRNLISILVPCHRVIGANDILTVHHRLLAQTSLADAGGIGLPLRS